MSNLSDEKRFSKSLSSQKAAVITHTYLAHTCHICAFIPLFTSDLGHQGPSLNQPNGEIIVFIVWGVDRRPSLD